MKKMWTTTILASLVLMAACAEQKHDSSGTTVPTTSAPKAANQKAAEGTDSKTTISTKLPGQSSESSIGTLTNKLADFVADPKNVVNLKSSDKSAKLIGINIGAASGPSSLIRSSLICSDSSNDLLKINTGIFESSITNSEEIKNRITILPGSQISYNTEMEYAVSSTTAGSTALSNLYNMPSVACDPGVASSNLLDDESIAEKIADKSLEVITLNDSKIYNVVDAQISTLKSSELSTFSIACNAEGLKNVTEALKSSIYLKLEKGSQVLLQRSQEAQKASNEKNKITDASMKAESILIQCSVPAKKTTETKSNPVSSAETQNETVTDTEKVSEAQMNSIINAKPDQTSNSRSKTSQNAIADADKFLG